MLILISWSAITQRVCDLIPWGAELMLTLTFWFAISQRVCDLISWAAQPMLTVTSWFVFLRLYVISFPEQLNSCWPWPPDLLFHRQYVISFPEQLNLCWPCLLYFLSLSGCVWSDFLSSPTYADLNLTISDVSESVWSGILTAWPQLNLIFIFYFP